jgi:hypothetical protein
MDFFPYLPPLISVYIIATSDFSKKYLTNTVQGFVTRKDELKNNEAVIRNIALSWATKLGFFNSMFAAMVSVFSIYSSTKSYAWATATFILLLAIFIPMLWWIMDHEPDQLVSITTRRGGLSHSRVCSLILIFVNIILVAAIAISQNTPKQQ